MVTIERRAMLISQADPLVNPSGELTGTRSAGHAPVRPNEMEDVMRFWKSGL